MWRFTLLLLYILVVLRIINASVRSSNTNGSQDGRFLESVQKKQSHLSLRRLAREPQQTVFKHQPCKGAARAGDVHFQSHPVCLTRRAHPNFLQSISDVENTPVASLLTSIVTHELSHCVLMLLWDETYARTPLVDHLVQLPNPKQVRALLHVL